MRRQGRGQAWPSRVGPGRMDDLTWITGIVERGEGDVLLAVLRQAVIRPVCDGPG